MSAMTAVSWLILLCTYPDFARWRPEGFAERLDLLEGKPWQAQLEAAGFKGDDAEIVMQPTTSADLDLEGAEKVLKLIDMLEDLDDVQNVYSNADIPESVAEQLG